MSGAVVTFPIVLEVKSIIGFIWPPILTMRRLLKPKLLADISISTPTPPAELVQNLTFQRDYRALAASSTAIALSIGSASYDTYDGSGDGAAVRGRDANWQTIYAAIRVAVEITKESSDLFPPLKAVVGAMSVLIKNCDVGVLFAIWIPPHPLPLLAPANIR
jgi:hypothetical protein